MALLDMLEGMLNLSDDDKATVNAAAPYVANWLDELNKQWGTLSNLIANLAASKPIVDRLINDGQQLAPIVSNVLKGGGSMFDAGPAMSAYNDAKAVIAANPKLVAGLQRDYQWLAPLIAQVESDMKRPEVQAAVELLQRKMGQQNVSMEHLMRGVLKEGTHE
jgi:hypothetical protein